MSRKGFTEMSRLLVNDSRIDLEKSGDTLCGDTALIVASLSGHADTVRILLDAEADVNHLNFAGDSPLIWAVRHGYIKVVKILWNHPGVHKDILDRDRMNLLQIAETNSHHEVAEFLRDYFSSSI
jgi:ankyrin repeat protein